jgi:hypothetical protein
MPRTISEKKLCLLTWQGFDLTRPCRTRPSRSNPASSRALQVQERTGPEQDWNSVNLVGLSHAGAGWGRWVARECVDRFNPTVAR